MTLRTAKAGGYLKKNTHTDKNFNSTHVGCEYGEYAEAKGPV